ncbi:MAG TPA: SurA N-terminal domain-containing protein [Xanthobacteraceae bacterium]|jgi:peptidyl-prolyl cis-trans isomerase SurA|nr:SurA N-terminal domain-containing protein [Xanthobacteraceae bacterium]
MAPILESSRLESSRTFLSGGRALCAVAVTAIILTATAAGGAHAQNVVAFVNGEPITQLDIDARSKLLEVSTPTHKAPPRQEVLDQLIDEKLEIREAKRWGIDPSEDDMNNSFASMAQRAGQTSDQFVQTLTKNGVTPQTFRQRLRAQLVWPPLVRGRYQSTLEVYDQDVLQEMLNKKTDDDAATSYDYTLRPILFVVPPGSPPTVFEDRKREADGLRNRFRSCDDGLPFARALNAVVVRDQIIRTSSDIPSEQRKTLDGVPVGQLTAPEITKLGVEMFAVCAKDTSKTDNTPGKRQARETLFNQKFEQQSKKYLQELRRQALIEYK